MATERIPKATQLFLDEKIKLIKISSNAIVPLLKLWKYKPDIEPVNNTVPSVELNTEKPSVREATNDTGAVKAIARASRINGPIIPKAE
jgi:hypothetical protein